MDNDSNNLEDLKLIKALREKTNKAYANMVKEVAKKLIGNDNNDKNIEDTSSKFQKLIDDVNKALNIKNRGFVIFLYMISTYYWYSIDDIKIEKIVEFYEEVKKLNIEKWKEE